MESKLCMNCFTELHAGDGRICPACGWDNGKPQFPAGLRYGTVLSSRYSIGRAKAMNGEGITYAALDQTTRRAVEIREFFPTTLAERVAGEQSVQPLPGHESAYARLLDDFLALSKGVSRLRELTVVTTVLDIFTENNTAYSVYEYVPATSLRKLIDHSGPLSWNAINRMFMPILTALGLINSLGIAHLGVSPETLRVTKDNTLLITGFSIRSARQAGYEIGEELFPGFAAVEQYDRRTVCGEASDVYALAACMVYAMTGHAPEPAPDRLRDQRLMISKEVLRSLPPYVVTAIANALQVRAEDRTASFERFKTELSSAPTIVNEVDQTHAIRRIPIDMEIGRRGLPPMAWLIGSLAITLVALFIVASVWMGERGMSFGDLKHLFDRETVSAQELETPYLINQEYAAWEERIAQGDYHFTLRVSDRIFNDTVQEGHIISQSPLAGEPLESGGEIVVTVSRGSATRTLPAVQGMSYETLEGILRADGFVPSRVEQASDGVEAGYVVGYEGHSEGDALEYGAAVTVIVSTGPAAE